jgi:hypothetical protein
VPLVLHLAAPVALMKKSFDTRAFWVAWLVLVLVGFLV